MSRVVVGQVWCWRCMRNEVAQAGWLCRNCDRGDRYRAAGGRRQEPVFERWEDVPDVIGGHEVDRAFWRGKVSLSDDPFGEDVLDGWEQSGM